MKRTGRRRSGQYKNDDLTREQALAVKEMMNREQELKFYWWYDILTVSTTGTFTSLPFDIAQGDTDEERLGDSLTWCGHMDLRFEITNGGAVTDVHNNIRVIVLQWFPNTVPTVASVLLNGPSGAPGIHSQYNHDNRQQYLILFDKCFVTVGNGTSTTYPPQSNHSTGGLYFNVPLTKAHKNVQYISGSTVGTNQFWIYFVSNSSSGSQPGIAYSTKVVFRDS